MKQNYFTVGFIALGIFFVGLNFYVFNYLNNGGLNFDINKAKSVVKSSAKAQAVLPDVKPGESYTKSTLRDAEINKIKNGIPFDSSQFKIDYTPKSKYLTVTVKASTIEKYRENKFLAEEKFLDLGATNLCILKIVWNVPVSLNDKINKQDLTTRSCSS